MPRWWCRWWCRCLVFSVPSETLLHNVSEVVSEIDWHPFLKSFQKSIDTHFWSRFRNHHHMGNYRFLKSFQKSIDIDFWSHFRNRLTPLSRALLETRVHQGHHFLKALWKTNLGQFGTHFGLNFGVIFGFLLVSFLGSILISI